ncbi:MAG: YkgJ family cysteine cluster protein [Acidobacteriota bacterium]
MSPSPADTHAELLALHDEVDAESARLAETLGPRLRCGRGCHDCCADELSVFAVEAELIRERHADLLATGTPHPVGACAFLDDEGSCRVYESRPYRCRSHGLPLRWIEPGPDDIPVEHRDICPLNEDGDPPLVELDETSCWTLGPVEGRLAALQHETTGDLRRVALRSLFANEAD